MKKFWVIFMILFVLGLSQTFAQTDAEIRQILLERIGSDADPKIGITVALIDENGVRFVHSSSENKAAAQAVYEIGSVTKVFTTTLLADMVKRGEVRLDDPVSKYLPANVKVPTFGDKQITLEHLATQTSGLPRIPGNFKPADPQNPYIDYTPEKLYEFLSNYSLTRVPGEKHEYSNLGIGLLGHALSLRLKMNLEDAIKGRILAPVGMKNTVMTLTPELRARLAPGFNPLGKPAANWDFSVLGAAGALRSTPEDVATFIQTNLGLRKSDLAEVFIAAQEPRTQASSPETRIGLGWMTSARNSAEITWHNGGTGGYRSFVGFDRKRKKGVAVLANASLDLDDIGFYLLGAGQLQKTLEVAPEILDKYVGEYQITPTLNLTITREGKRLFFQPTGQAKVQVFAESETEFVIRQVRAKIKFNKNEKGEVSGLTFSQMGRETPARKIK
jgi:CubicO group peptidase (beta-lactamase class C family)